MCKILQGVKVKHRYNISEKLHYKLQMQTTAEPVRPSVWVSSVLTEVDSSDGGHIHRLTSNGHSSTSSHWTV